MARRLVTLVGGLVSVFLIVASLGGLLGGAPAAAAPSQPLPWYARLVPVTEGQTWDRQPGSLATGRISVIVHLNMAPLAMVGKGWSHQQRRDYVTQIRAAQDAVIPQIEALGGTIVGRFAHVSTGLAVEIDALRVDALRSIGNVIGVRGVGTYSLDLSETVPWIGAAALAPLGVTGEGVDVAVIDSGIDYTHAKLGGSGLVSDYDACYATNTTVGDCPFFPNARVKGGYDWVGELWPTFSSSIAPDPDPIDFEGHGTHVADIIGGSATSPGSGDAGVAPGVNLWGFKACSAVSSSCNGLALLLAVDDALDLDDSDYGACTPGTDPGCTTYDPADVINMSLGSPYGQPEDDLSHFANIASYYGSLVVVSAGNSGDRPYIVGSPSTADAAVSVAQSTVPSDKFYTITVGNASVGGVLQPWAPPITTPIAGPLQYGNGASGNLNGCAAFPPDSLAGKVLLVDRGVCNISAKMSNGAAAGALAVIIANNSFSNTPPSFSFGGASAFAPTLTTTQNGGAVLKGVLGQVATLGPTSFIALPDDIVASSGRGPRIADGAIKPDIAAPGASVSAEVGTGTGKTAFGGTSGAAPMIAGAAALIIAAFEDRGLLDSDPGLDGAAGASFAPVVKSLLMNAANPNTYIGGGGPGGSGFLAPITLQGAGRVDALAAYGAETIAWDVTDLMAWMYDPNREGACPVTTPPTNALTHLILPEAYNGSFDCLSAYPFGNDFFNAWNKQTGSLSFGYDGVSRVHKESRTVAVLNLSGASKTYNLGSSFRYSDDLDKGVALTLSPSSLTVAPGSVGFVRVSIQVNANKLRDWTLDAGEFGASGTNIFCSDTNPSTGCPTLQIFEYDGFVTVDGGANNTARLPWQILPKRAAGTYVAGKSASTIRLLNPVGFNPAEVEVFSLIEQSPNNCEIVDENGDCVNADYVPGILPGINQTAIDIKEVGVRSFQLPGLNAALGLPAAPSGAINDEVVDFAVTVYDAPFRASHNYPVEFDIYVDNNRDGTDDYVIFNADQTLNAADGRNAVFVADINPTDGTRPLRPYFYSNTDFNSQNWILPVPAAAIGVASNQPFDFLVLAFDAYFTGSLWDCAPSNCADYHTYQTGLPRFQPAISSVTIPVHGNYRLNYTQPSGGSSASASQTGLLFLYRDAEVGRESDAVPLP